MQQLELMKMHPCHAQSNLYNNASSSPKTLSCQKSEDERQLQTIEKTLRFQHEYDLMNGTSDAGLLNINCQVGLLWNLIRIIDTGEALDLSISGFGIDTSLIGTFGMLERSSDVDEVEVTVFLNDLSSMLSGVLVWGNRGSNDGCTSPSKLRRNESDPTDVSGSISTAEAKFRGKLSSNSLTEEEGDGSATLLVQCDVESTSNRILSAVLVTSEEDSEALC
jgi:hypothetical protein